MGSGGSSSSVEATFLLSSFHRALMLPSLLYIVHLSSPLFNKSFSETPHSRPF